MWSELNIYFDHMIHNSKSIHSILNTLYTIIVYSINQDVASRSLFGTSGKTFALPYHKSFFQIKHAYVLFNSIMLTHHSFGTLFMWKLVLTDFHYVRPCFDLLQFNLLLFCNLNLNIKSMFVKIGLSL